MKTMVDVLSLLTSLMSHYYTAVVSVLIATLLFIAHSWIGLFDRPILEDCMFLQPSRRRMWCVLAMTNDQPKCPSDADKLFFAARTVIDDLKPMNIVASSAGTVSSSPLSSNNKPLTSLSSSSLLLSKAAYHYSGDPTPSSSIACTVYFEEQGRSSCSRSSSSPTGHNARHSSSQTKGYNKYRCGCGYLVGLESLSEAKSLLSRLETTMTSSSSLARNNNGKYPYPIRVVDLGTGPARKGRLQWRNRYTPWIARLLHWNTEFSKICGGDVDIVECELIVRRPVGLKSVAVDFGPTVSYRQPGYIDYLLLNAKTTNIWNPNDYAHVNQQQQSGGRNSIDTAASPTTSRSPSSPSSAQRISNTRLSNWMTKKHPMGSKKLHVHI